ncbi:MAG TPA: methyltransferase domain-containing protein [Allosphingosinicella sp.]
MIFPNERQTEAEVAGHYDELDAVYRDIWGEHVHHGYWRTGRETPAEATEALTFLVAERLAVGRGARLCDIGCGYGASAEYMASRFGAEVTGLSLSQAQVKLAQARRPAAGAIRILRQDWLDNDLPDASFDGAYAIESSEHMVDKARFFAEAARVLRPGGRLVVCAWLASSKPSGFDVRHLLEPICREGRLPGMGSREDYEALAAGAGFAPLGFEDIGRQVRRTWSICARRLAWKLLTDGNLRRMALDKKVSNRSFLLSIPRLMLALRTGAMRYGVFVWEKPA